MEKLTGYYFNSNNKAEELGYKDKSKQVGVIAQEVQQVDMDQDRRLHYY